MRISTDTHYASRLLLDLALNAAHAPLPVTVLADNTGIPLAHVGDVMEALLVAGFVSQGPGDGFQLGRRPEEITLGQVVRVMDGGIRLNHCRSVEDRCPECHKCKTKDVWAGVIEAIERELDSITLVDLMAPPLPVSGSLGVHGQGGAVR